MGFIKKIHGVKGQVRLRAHRYFEDAISNASFLFLGLYGEMVPFAVKSIQGENPFIVHFEDVLSPQDAESIKSTRVYLPVAEVSDIMATGESDLSGFSINLPNGERIGEIVKVEEFPEQLMATVRLSKDNREVLIPLNDTFIDKIDMENKEVHMDLPDGIMDL